jgi:hypothetical protein
MAMDSSEVSESRLYCREEWGLAGERFSAESDSSGHSEVVI